jgi:hypothetical protein
VVDGAVASASCSAQISTADHAGAAFTCTVSEKQTQTTLTRECEAATLAFYPQFRPLRIIPNILFIDQVNIGGSILTSFCVGLDDDSGCFVVIGVTRFQCHLNRALG